MLKNVYNRKKVKHHRSFYKIYLKHLDSFEVIGWNTLLYEETLMSDGMLEAYSVVREMFKTEAEIANRDAEIVELGKKLTQSEASTASMITRQRYQTLSPRLCQQQLRSFRNHCGRTPRRRTRMEASSLCNIFLAPFLLVVRDSPCTPWWKEGVGLASRRGRLPDIHTGNGFPQDPSVSGTLGSRP